MFDLIIRGDRVVTPAGVGAYDVAIQGHPGQKTLQDVVNSVRKCAKAVC